ncbi:UNVERIFIED_CONTAM: hypothetical protein NCL1_12127 [Trichonephila clavipes]
MFMHALYHSLISSNQMILLYAGISTSYYLYEFNLYAYSNLILGLKNLRRKATHSLTNHDISGTIKPTDLKFGRQVPSMECTVLKLGRQIPFMSLRTYNLEIRYADTFRDVEDPLKNGFLRKLTSKWRCGPKRARST